MSDDFDLIADIREDQGKGASRRLRHQGKVPAIIYGAGRPPRALVFDHNRVLQQLENESFYSSVLNIKVGEKSQAAILKDVQRHPAKPRSCTWTSSASSRTRKSRCRFRFTSSAKMLRLA